VSDSAIVFLVLGVIVVLFVWNRVPVEIVAIGASLTLAATGVLTLDQSLSGFGDATVVFIAALFVVSEAIDSTGVTAWAGQQLTLHAGSSPRRLMLLTMLLVAFLTALISVNGAVAALIPMVVVIAIRIGQPPSRWLMPLAFGAHAGSMLALTGTPVHILVVDAAVGAGEAGFRYLEFSLVGIPLVAGVVAIVVLFGSRLLPGRTPDSLPPNLTDHCRTVVDQYGLGSAVRRLSVGAGSPFVGMRGGSIDVSPHDDINLVAVQRADASRSSDAPIESGDVLAVGGTPASVERFASDYGLEVLPGRVEGPDPFDRVTGIAEVVVPPRSAIVGETVFPGMITASGDFVVLAVQRNGENQDRGSTVLAPGDALLVQGAWDALDAAAESDDLLIVDSPALIRRQAVPMGPRARRSIAILIGMVILLVTNVVPAAAAALVAALAMVLSRVMTMQQAYRGINWTTVILVGAMIPLSTAVETSGAADTIADGLLGVVGDSSPYALLLGLFVITAVFGQLISNTATALIVIPIAVTAAADIGVSVRPVLMTVTVAAAASFLTPVATPANLMVMEPGGYEFRDYWKLGLPMLLLFMVVAVLLVPVIWPF
jgi:di/tricarboxylate transporter